MKLITLLQAAALLMLAVAGAYAAAHDGTTGCKVNSAVVCEV